MRFEIGPGGGFVILVGLAGLSAAVFFLGMISGREIAQSEQGQSQLASVYPMPAGAPSVSAPPQPVAPPQLASTPPAALAPTAVTQPKPPLRHKTPPRPTLASVPPARVSVPAAEEPYSSAPSDSGSSDEDTGTGEASASNPPSHATHGRGYNIVIDAAMDRGAATRMASRLLGLGYTSHIVPTQISGQTWYRVQIGPYPSAEDARAAQAQLRAAYTARYVNRAGASSTGSSRGADTSDSSGTDSSDDNGGASGPSD